MWCIEQRSSVTSNRVSVIPAASANQNELRRHTGNKLVAGHFVIFIILEVHKLKTCIRILWACFRSQSEKIIMAIMDFGCSTLSDHWKDNSLRRHNIGNMASRSYGSMTLFVASDSRTWTATTDTPCSTERCLTRLP